MRAIVLSAGQGSRLLPLTMDRPKCLLPVGSRSTLQWQIEALSQAREIDEIVVITGFKSEMVDEELARLRRARPSIKTLFNPFYKVADNLASCWMARDLMHEDFLIVNGDTLFEVAVLAHVLENPKAPVTLTINRKPVFDSDDMKVRLDGDRVLAVSKTLAQNESDAESIGIVQIRGEGCAQFRAQAEAGMRDGWGVGSWYLQAIDRLAKETFVAATDIGKREWCEIDFPSDLEAATKLAQCWEKLRIVA